MGQERSWRQEKTNGLSEEGNREDSRDRNEEAPERPDYVAGEPYILLSLATIRERKKRGQVQMQSDEEEEGTPGYHLFFMFQVQAGQTGRGKGVQDGRLQPVGDGQERRPLPLWKRVTEILDSWGRGKF